LGVTTDGDGDRPDDPDWIANLAAQRRGHAGPTPRGRSVSSALILPRGVLPWDLQLRHLLATIDAVHGDGALPPLPVRWGILAVGLVAEFRSSFDHVEAISLTINPNRARWMLAAVHEIGHFLDHQGIDPTNEPASRRHPNLDEWRQRVRESTAIRILARLVGPEDYLMRFEELWARSYVQWIAIRSGDPTLLHQVVESRESRPADPIFYGQWDAADFDPIGDAIDRLFRRLGWRV
jgi:hypothetical protein